jgi:hypothetical protein
VRGGSGGLFNNPAKGPANHDLLSAGHPALATAGVLTLAMVAVAVVLAGPPHYDVTPAEALSGVDTPTVSLHPPLGPGAASSPTTDAPTAPTTPPSSLPAGVDLTAVDSGGTPCRARRSPGPARRLRAERGGLHALRHRGPAAGQRPDPLDVNGDAYPAT